MQEIELKFQIPAGALAALTAEIHALAGGDQPPQRLQAAYFDTADRKLARARAALRVRQEDDDWVQTLKAAGPNGMTRLEDNRPVTFLPSPPLVVPLASFSPEGASDTGEAIRPDLSRHVDEAVRQALVRDLGWQPDKDPVGDQTGLLLLYRTDMRRLRARVDTAGLSPPSAHTGEVEIALDLGEIAAGSLRRPVRELEIELTSGDPRAVLDMARHLVSRHGLWLDTQTKAHRGDQLAREADSGRPSPMPPAQPRARIKPGMSPVQAWLAGVDAALDQIGACLSEVALRDWPPSDSSASSASVASLSASRPSEFKPPSSESLDSSPWIQGWATGLRRLGWLWRHAPAFTPPAESTSSAEAREALHQTIARHLATLHPGAGRWLDDDGAAAFARSPAPTLLALDVFEVLVAMGS